MNTKHKNGLGVSKVTGNSHGDTMTCPHCGECYDCYKENYQHVGGRGDVAVMKCGACMGVFGTSSDFDFYSMRGRELKTWKHEYLNGFRDINGNELKDGDSIINTRGPNPGNIRILKLRDFSNSPLVKDSLCGGRVRLCIGDSVSEPTPDWVDFNGIVRHNY